MEQLAACRKRIDEINGEMERLLLERMELAAEIGKTKRTMGKPTFDPAREQEILTRFRKNAPPRLANYVVKFFQELMLMSRVHQDREHPLQGELVPKIREALERTPKLFPESASVACQGVEGAYSQIACSRLFQYPEMTYLPQFEDVFKAVISGECAYGVLPIENSSFGSVNDVYDLMKRYRAYIVKGMKLRIHHNLLSKPGVKIEDIREIFSHSQAIGQCGRFLSEHPKIKVTPCTNTAVAAKMVADADRRDVAAISSRECAALYGLCSLNDSISDSDSNYTRFICISKELQIYPGAAKISMIVELGRSHRPGALNALLSRFALLGVNLVKLESRPIPGRDFEFKFYFDLEASIYSEDVLSLLSELEAEPDPFQFLGSYIEM